MLIPRTWQQKEDAYIYEEERAFLECLNNTIQNKKEIKVANVGFGSSLAFTDKRTISLNFETIKKECQDSKFGGYFEFLLTLKCFDYHELCHCMFTKYGKITDWKIRDAINLLEDQRVENIFAMKYNKAKHYFRFLMTKMILNSKAVNMGTYMLIYGRRFILNSDRILSELRKLALKKYPESIMVEIENIIDEYLATLSIERQKELASLLTQLLGYDRMPENPLGNESEHRSTARKTDSTEEKELNAEVKKQIKEEKEQEKDSSKEDDDSDSDGDSDSNSSKEDDDSNSDGDSDSNSSKEDDDSNSDGDSDLDCIKGKIYAEKESIEGNDINDIENDIENQMSSMEKYNFGAGGDGFENPNMIFTPDKSHVAVSQKLEKTLKNIRNDLGNKTVYNQKKGFLNMRKAMMNESITKFTDFKKYIPSRLNKTKLAVNIFIDSSGSMNDTEYNTAIGTGWAIAKALENTNSMTKVYEFSNNFKTIKNYNNIVKKSAWGRNFRGGTVVVDALNDSIKGFDDVQKVYGIKSKLAIVVTDGGFEYNTSQKTIETIDKMRDKKIVVMLLKVRNKDWSSNDAVEKRFNRVIQIKSFNDLNSTISEMVRHMQAEIVMEVTHNGY